VEAVFHTAETEPRIRFGCVFWFWSEMWNPFYHLIYFFNFYKNCSSICEIQPTLTYSSCFVFVFTSTKKMEDEGEYFLFNNIICILFYYSYG